MRFFYLFLLGVLPLFSWAKEPVNGVYHPGTEIVRPYFHPAIEVEREVIYFNPRTYRKANITVEYTLLAKDSPDYVPFLLYVPSGLLVNRIELNGGLMTERYPLLTLDRLEREEFSGYEHLMDHRDGQGFDSEFTRGREVNSFIYFDERLKPGINRLEIRFEVESKEVKNGSGRKYSFHFGSFADERAIFSGTTQLEIDKFAEFAFTPSRIEMDGNTEWERIGPTVFWGASMSDSLVIEITTDLGGWGEFLISISPEGTVCIFGLLLVLLHTMFIFRHVRKRRWEKRSWMFLWGAILVPLLMGTLYYSLVSVINGLLGEYAVGLMTGPGVIIVFFIFLFPPYLLVSFFVHLMARNRVKKKNIMLKNRLLGSWIGAAIGDGFGAVTEFKSLDVIRSMYGPEGLTEPPSGTIKVTDDTQMAMAVAKALMGAYQDGEVPIGRLEDALRKEYVVWLNDPENNRAPGRTCLTACHNLERGMEWTAATVKNSKGCGANMRVLPVGLFKFKGGDEFSEIEIARWAQLQAAMTQGHATGLAASELTALTVVWLLEGEKPERLVDRLLAHARSQQSVYHESVLKDLWQRPGVDSPEEYIRRGWQENIAVLERVKDAAINGDPALDPCYYSGEGWIAEEAFGTALLSFLWYADDPVKTLIRAVNTKGDSDSLACIAGAFAGAYKGISELPEDWTDRIEYREELFPFVEFLVG